MSSGLFGSLTAAARALEAQRFGLDVTGQNIGNVNTPGYTRRELDLAAVPPADATSAGRGVDVVGIRAVRDQLLDRRLLLERPAEQREAAIADALRVVESLFGSPGQSLDGRLAALFDAFGRLAEEPMSASARHEVIQQGQALAEAFGLLSDRLDNARRDANARIVAGIDEVNVLAARIADINRSLALGQGSGSALHLRDEQLRALDQLGALMDVSTIARADGSLDVTFANGRPLVVGDRAYGITAVPAPPAGFVELQAGDFVVTSEVTAGRLGGLLHVRDGLVVEYRDRLDALAFAVADEIDTRHASGFDLDGNPAGTFFAALGGVAGAASSLAMNGALAADPRRLAAAGGPMAGDNQVARALAGLRDERVLDGGLATLTDGWARLVYRVGRDAQAADYERRSRGEVVRQVELLREAISGVSLDEEALNMLRFQRAYEANARFFRVVDDAIETLLRMVRA